MADTTDHSGRGARRLALAGVGGAAFLHSALRCLELVRPSTDGIGLGGRGPEAGTLERDASVLAEQVTLLDVFRQAVEEAIAAGPAETDRARPARPGTR